MLFSSTFIPLVAAAAATATVIERQIPGPPITILSPGCILSPTDGTDITAGDSFPLEIAVPEYSHCAPLYTSVWIYLLEDKPTTSSLNSTDGFSDYLYYFGEWVRTNIPGKDCDNARRVVPIIAFTHRSVSAAEWLSSPVEPDRARPGAVIQWPGTLFCHY